MYKCTKGLAKWTAARPSKMPVESLISLRGLFEAPSLLDNIWSLVFQCIIQRFCIIPCALYYTIPLCRSISCQQYYLVSVLHDLQVAVLSATYDTGTLTSSPRKLWHHCNSTQKLKLEASQVCYNKYTLKIHVRYI